MRAIARQEIRAQVQREHEAFVRRISERGGTREDFVKAFGSGTYGRVPD